jgi:hypothetical protein
MHSHDIKCGALAWMGVFILGVLSPDARADQRIVCPLTVDARQVRVDAPDGWIGIFGPEGMLKLQGVQAIFVPRSLRDDAWGEFKDPPTTKTGDVVTTHYPLPLEMEKYVICDYGQRVYQAMKLPETTTECFVVQRLRRKIGKNVVEQTASDITCK